jgi:GWxTD domain-containing protein
MILFLLLLSAGTIDLHVDPVVYRTTITIEDTIEHSTHPEDIFYIEFNCGAFYQDFYYETIDSSIITKATIVFRLSCLTHVDFFVDTLYRQFTIPSFSEAARQQMSFIIQFGLHVPEGLYEYEIHITSGDKAGTVGGSVEVIKDHYKISDILLASAIVTDTTENYLRKGSLKVIPHPSGLFNRQYTTLYAYYEIYDILPDDDSLEIFYSIVNHDNKIIRKISRYLAKRFSSQAVNFGINIQGIDPGEYSFRVHVRDPVGDVVTEKTVPFTIAGITKKEISYEGMPYYDEIEYFLTPHDYEYFQSLPKEGKDIFLKRFWESQNYFEIAERFEYVDANYQEGGTAGRKTDRGRIYIKYGLPDEIERSIIEYYESRSYEHWQYYNGHQFLFIDIRGTNEYTLVWTNVSGEQSQPTLYKYIPPNKIHLIR